MFSRKSRLTLCIVGLLIILLVSACNSSINSSTYGIYSVDATFSDFYKQFGGESILGPAISLSFIKQGVTYQYVVTGLMTYDPGLEALKRYHFWSMASVEWHINGLVEPSQSETDNHYVNGHRIWEEVWSLYDQFGSDIIGLPITGVSANDAKQRYEQYFEGIGFYRNYADQPGQIHLMPYGSWMCGSNCQYQVSDSNPPSPSYSRDYSEIEQLFLQASEQLGYGFSGAPLTSPHQGSDGYYEMNFENIIMYLDTANGNQIKLRPLPAWLGVQPDQPQTAIKADWLSFIPTQDLYGFNVPNTFIDYLNEHGKLTYSGYPITEFRDLADRGYSQCFTNLCLEYHPTAPKELQIRPHMLGAEYLSLGDKSNASGTNLINALQINAWEQYPLIASGRMQVINIEATQNNTPMRGIEFSLLVKQPDGLSKTYTLKPTGDDGKTSIELDPINGPNGAIVQYQVCVIGGTTSQVCFSRSYTIWEQ